MINTTGCGQGWRAAGNGKSSGVLKNYKIHICMSIYTYIVVWSILSSEWVIVFMLLLVGSYKIFSDPEKSTQLCCFYHKWIRKIGGGKTRTYRVNKTTFIHHLIWNHFDDLFWYYKNQNHCVGLAQNIYHHHHLIKMWLVIAMLLSFKKGSQWALVWN
jgi:hypothetical protein